MDRVQKQFILNDLDKKMVLIVGPRQAGKTWLAKHIATEFERSLYLNYDNPDDRRIIHQRSWFPSTDLLILDELHKMPHWKNYLKGIYDTKEEQTKIIVTGSARLDVFKNLGDPMAGRYYTHHLFPLSPAELTQLNQPVDIDKLMLQSGFPEPFLQDSLTEANRWRMQYVTSLMTHDVFDIDNVQNIKALKLTLQLLQQRVGSPISFQSLAEDVHVSPNTIKKYIQLFEALYIIFRVTPFHKNIARSLLKEPKIYFFDTGLVKGSNGVKLENFVATCLLKHMYGRRDYFAEDYALYYLRTKDKQEVDFALVKEGDIEKIIEVKQSNDVINKSLEMFHKKYQLPALQIVKNLQHPHRVGAIEILRLKDFLLALYL